MYTIYSVSIDQILMYIVIVGIADGHGSDPWSDCHIVCLLSVYVCVVGVVEGVSANLQDRVFWCYLVHVRLVCILHLLLPCLSYSVVCSVLPCYMQCSL